MITCKYCGTELKFIGEKENERYFECDFCEQHFTLDETSSDRKRKMSVPQYIDADINLPISEFFKRDTITLFFSLKETRKYWYSVKNLLENLKVHYKDGEIPQAPEDENEKFKKELNALKNEYTRLTKQKFVIENILLERAGFIPEKITDDFLNTICDSGEVASSKPMYIYIK